MTVPDEFPALVKHEDPHPVVHHHELPPGGDRHRDGLHHFLVAERTDLVPLKVDLGHDLGPPVNSDQGVLVDPEADPGDAPPLQSGAPDVVLELELGVEHLDPAVAGVHHEDPVVHVQGEAAGLDEPVVPGAVAAVTQEGRVVSGHLEKHRTISDGAGKNEHLEKNMNQSPGNVVINAYLQTICSNTDRCESDLIRAIVKI